MIAPRHDGWQPPWIYPGQQKYCKGLKTSLRLLRPWTQGRWTSIEKRPPPTFGGVGCPKHLALYLLSKQVAVLHYLNLFFSLHWSWWISMVVMACREKLQPIQVRRYTSILCNTYHRYSMRFEAAILHNTKETMAEGATSLFIGYKRQKRLYYRHLFFGNFHSVRCILLQHRLSNNNLGDRQADIGDLEILDM